MNDYKAIETLILKKIINDKIQQKMWDTGHLGKI